MEYLLKESPKEASRKLMESKINQTSLLRLAKQQMVQWLIMLFKYCKVKKNLLAIWNKTRISRNYLTSIMTKNPSIIFSKIIHMSLKCEMSEIRLCHTSKLFKQRRGASLISFMMRVVNFHLNWKGRMSKFWISYCKIWLTYLFVNI